MFRLLGSGIVIAGVAVVGIVNAYDRSANYIETEAEIFRIDRTCTFVIEGRGSKGLVKSSKDEDCSSTDEFSKIRKQDKASRGKDVKGDAVVKVSYTSPLDHSYQTGELKFDGHDEQFYTLNAHQKIRILVSKTDPSKIKLY